MIVIFFHCKIIRYPVGKASSNKHLWVMEKADAIILYEQLLRLHTKAKQGEKITVNELICIWTFLNEEYPYFEQSFMAVVVVSDILSMLKFDKNPEFLFNLLDKYNDFIRTFPKSPYKNFVMRRIGEFLKNIPMNEHSNLGIFLKMCKL